MGISATLSKADGTETFSQNCGPADGSSWPGKRPPECIDQVISAVADFELCI
jgi:hypothetical protein